MQWELIKSSPEIIEYIDNTLGDFNKSQVNYNSKMDYLPPLYGTKIISSAPAMV